MNEKRRVGNFFRRNSVIIGLAIIFLCAFATLYINTAVLIKLQREIAIVKNISAQNKRLNDQLTRAVGDIKTDNSNRLNTLINHEDCLVSLFKQPTRPVPQIIDIKSCDLKILGQPAGKTSATKASAPATTATPAPQTPKNSSNNTSTKQAPPPNKPLSVSVCVPFTNVCVLQ